MQEIIVLLQTGILLIICSWLDIRNRIVSVKILAAFAVAGAGTYVLLRQMPIWQLLAGVAVGGFMMLASKITRGGIGIGDGGLLCVTGLYLGFYRNLELLLTALVLAAAWGVGLLVIKRAGRKTEMPFVPFLAVAYIGLLAV